MRKTVHDYYRQAWQGFARAPRSGAWKGSSVFGAGGNCASFQVELEAGRITRAVYRCTTCVTLVALCEHLAELAVGSSVEEAAAWEAQLLLRRHPEVPRERRDRAELAVRALRAALRSAAGGMGS